VDANAGKVASAAKRFVELTDLVALRKVGVEVVLAVEDAAVCDLASERKSQSHTEINCCCVGNRQSAWQA
jgi:hypothetical protein